LTVSIAIERRELGVLRAWRSAQPDPRHHLDGGDCDGVIGLTLGLVVGAIHLYYSLE